MASSFQDDDDFDEYNPHPYQGGYNIALTYGSPLPPSSATCYPINGVFPDSSPPVRTPTPPVRSPDGDGAVTVPDQPHQVDLGYPWYDHLCLGSSGFFGCGRWDYSEENSHWRSLRRAADYLFGYSQGFGERRIGVDSYGIPIYANKKHSCEALTLQAQPAINQKIEFHEWPSVYGEESQGNAEIENHGNWPSVYGEESQGNAEIENHGNESSFYAYENHGNENSFYDYDNHHYEEPTHVQFGEYAVPSWSWDAVNHKDYPEQGREDESYSSGNPIYAYEKHQYGQPLSVEVNPVEHGWMEQLEYHEIYEEQASFESSNWYSSSYGEWGNNRHASENSYYNASENSYYNYERGNYVEQPEYGELEPYQPTWSQFPGYHQDYKDEVPYESNKSDDPRDIVAQIFSYQNYSVYDE